MIKNPFEHKVNFDEKKHIYYWIKNPTDSIKMPNSVTGLISKKNPFDKEKISWFKVNNYLKWTKQPYTEIREKVLSNNRDSDKKSIKQTLQREVIKLWDQWRQEGVDVHKISENYNLFGIEYTGMKYKPHWNAIVTYFDIEREKNGFKTLWVELRISHPKLVTKYDKINPGVGGSIDIVMYNEERKMFKLMDIKVVKSVTSQKRKKWKLQLGFYNYILNQFKNETFPYICETLEILRIDESLVKNYEVYTFKTKECEELVKKEFFI